MRKIIVHEFITLDGVIQAPGSPTEDTDGGFSHGGWTLPYWQHVAPRRPASYSDVSLPGIISFRSQQQADTHLLFQQAISFQYIFLRPNFFSVAKRRLMGLSFLGLVFYGTNMQKRNSRRER